MKTTKNLILSIALVALATTSFGQLPSIKDRLFKKQKNQVEYITAEYSNENSRVENWMHDLRSWSSDKASKDAYVAPVVTSSFIIENVEVVYEEELGLEIWMTNSFECSGTEDALFLEAWMEAPFANNQIDESLNIENWMIIPFEVTESIEMESWMTATWI